MMKKVLHFLLFVFVLLASLTSPAFAYNKSAATAYANVWWDQRNPSYPDFGSWAYQGADCANFVSQAIYAGGYSMHKNLNQNVRYQWWIESNWYGRYDYSNSWSVAADLRKFLLIDSPGASSEGTAPGSSMNYWTPTNVTSGDPIFYDWGTGEGISHVSIQTGYGTDPKSLVQGNFVNQHQTNRQHAFWSLRPYNANWRTTTIYFVHIDSSNS